MSIACTVDELTEIECCILDACQKAKEKGFTITRHTTLDLVNKVCCPLGAWHMFSIHFNKKASDSYSYLLYKSYETLFPKNVDDNFTSVYDTNKPGFAFVIGFDKLTPKFNITNSFYKMGVRFSNRLDRGEI